MISATVPLSWHDASATAPSVAPGMVGASPELSDPVSRSGSAVFCPPEGRDLSGAAETPPQLGV